MHKAIERYLVATKQTKNWPKATMETYREALTYLYMLEPKWLAIETTNLKGGKNAAMNSLIDAFKCALGSKTMLASLIQEE